MSPSHKPPDSATRRAADIVRRFAINGAIIALDPLPGGHINESYQVTVRWDGMAHHTKRTASYLLQCINPNVFPDGAHVMENIVNITRHISAKLQAAGIEDWRRRTLTLVPTHKGGAWYRDPDSKYLRLYHFIHRSSTRERARTPGQAGKAARAFGTFLRFVADYNGPPLHETIRGFHDTDARFMALEAAIHNDPCRRVSRARQEIELALGYQSMASVLPRLIQSGEVPTRVVHNDAKITNVLFDSQLDEAICVVDLDTVMPGSALYDFGDLVRSTVSLTNEDEQDLSRIAVRPLVFKALVAGYLEGAGEVLTDTEKSLLVFAGQLITLEQGVRFLTDYLTGDQYYRVAYGSQNLKRCKAQFRLFEILREKEKELEKVITACSS